MLARAYPTARQTGMRTCCIRSRTLLFAACLASVGNALPAQTAVQNLGGPTMPTPIPLSGRMLPDNPVVVTQQPVQGASGNSIDVLHSTVVVQGPYAGSVATGQASPETLQLTLDDALKRALHANLGKLTQDASVQQAEGQRLVARSALLPNLNIGAAELFEKENLRTVGLKTSLVPPSTVFNYDDLRGLLRQSIVDLVSVHQFHGATELLKSSMASARNARDLIVLAVGGSYLQVTATGARLQASRAQALSARAVYERARDRYDAGLAARLDATRAEVQMETEEQRTIALQAELDIEKLRLARLAGLPIGQGFAVSDVYGFHPGVAYTLETALDRAAHQRQDLLAAESSVKAADAAVKAAHSERLPSVQLRADAGIAGTAPTQTSLGVYTVTGTVLIPVYNGGRISGDERQAEAAQHQRKAEYEDTRAQVDQDVRTALIQLNAAHDQVLLAQRNQQLAHETLEQSTDRFLVGVTDTVEVVQAEHAVLQADDDAIVALFQHNLAKLSLARAMGGAEETLPQLLRK